MKKMKILKKKTKSKTKQHEPIKNTGNDKKKSKKYLKLYKNIKKNP